MTFHSSQKFGVSSLIDQLRGISNSIHPIVEQEDSFTFQCLPENTQSRRICKHPYLENETWTSINGGRTREHQQQVASRAQERMGYFEDVQDFQNRKSQVFDIQKKYLSVISFQNSAPQLKETKKRIFRNKSQSGASMPVSYTEDKPLVKYNWFRQKQQLFGMILQQFKTAATQCYAHIPEPIIVVQRQTTRKDTSK